MSSAINLEGRREFLTSETGMVLNPWFLVLNLGGDLSMFGRGCWAKRKSLFTKFRVIGMWGGARTATPPKSRKQLQDRFREGVKENTRINFCD